MGRKSNRDKLDFFYDGLAKKPIGAEPKRSQVTPLDTWIADHRFLFMNMAKIFINELAESGEVEYLKQVAVSSMATDFNLLIVKKFILMKDLEALEYIAKETGNAVLGSEALKCLPSEALARLAIFEVKNNHTAITAVEMLDAANEIEYLKDVFSETRIPDALAKASAALSARGMLKDDKTGQAV